MTAELTIKHVTKTVRSPAHAGAYGFAEAFGKAMAYAIVIGVFVWGVAPFMQANSSETETTE